MMALAMRDAVIDGFLLGRVQHILSANNNELAALETRTTGLGDGGKLNLLSKNDDFFQW